jgi:hypothetical protein
MKKATTVISSAAKGTARLSKGYYNWASAIKGSKTRSMALLAPPVLALSLFLGLTTNPEPEAPAVSKTVEQPAAAEEKPEIDRNFRQYLPAANQELQNYVMSDPYINGFFLSNDIWIGNTTREDLTSRGFFVNPLYKHTGSGDGPTWEAKGACSVIGFDGAFMCSQGLMSAYQWGIQSDKVIAQLNVLEENW